MHSYVLVAARLGWLLTSLEQTLSNCQDGTRVDVAFVQSGTPGRLPTDDEATAAITALTDLGILVRLDGICRLDRARLDATADYRRGVHDALTLCVPTPKQGGEVKLCVALPPSLDPAIERELRYSARDLRSTIVDIVAAARVKVILASPFWDADTVAEIAGLLERRLDAGVQVLVLGRFGLRGGSDVIRQLLPLTGRPNFQLLEWYESSVGDPFGALTFHFKAVVADGGENAYLGTANFTTSGLRSRLEIGVVLRGEIARKLARIVDAVLHLAQPVRLADS